MRTPPADCVEAARLSDKRWGVFASVSLAQGIDESAWFTKASGRFNFFGIKAAPGQDGVDCYTHEEVDGRLEPRTCRFRNFTSVEEAFDAHGRLIATGRNARGQLIYGAAMAVKSDLSAFIHALAPVYATDKAYEAKVKALISEENLTRYDATQ